METEYENQEYTGPHSHPYLHEPLLYISNLPAYVTDENLAVALVTCGPFRPKINRDTDARVLSGTVEFKDLGKAERALATLQSRPILGLQPPVSLVLSPYPQTTPPTPLPPPSAHPRIVKFLPMDFTDQQLYDIFRPFGALASARTQTQFGPDTGVVEFWNEDDARIAEEALHCSDVDGQSIVVQIYQPRRTSGSFADFSPSAQPFVPSGTMFSNFPTQYSPPRPSHYSPRSSHVVTPPVPFVHGPGQQVQLAPLSGPGSNSHSGLIDPCNLFCKNLDPEIDSNGLFSHFRAFGQIVSARVMRNENGESRGFGFVSFQHPDQAATALNTMNGMTIGSKQIVVRLHEPKQLRQEKLAQRFGANGHPRNSSGATSPTLSDGGESFQGFSSPKRGSRGLGSPVASHYERDRGRRGSGSYYNAALTGNLNVTMQADSLATLSPVVRKEIITGDLTRRIRALDVVPSDDIEGLVESLSALSLPEVIQLIEDNDLLSVKVSAVTGLQVKGSPSPDKSPSRSASTSQDSRLLDPGALAATASAPEHPSTPISFNASLSTPPRTSSPSGSVPPTSERDRLYAAICKLEMSKQSELTDLIMGLSKRERAMCLFNPEQLRSKLIDAKVVLECEDEVEVVTDATSSKSAPDVPSTPQAKRNLPQVEDSPRTPDLSRGRSATSSPLPETPAGPSHSIASLAKLPAAEIIRILGSPAASSLPVAKADPLVTQSTDEFIDSVLSQPQPQQKQQVGDKLFKLVKSFGIKNAPKITIALLDQEDLRCLAHLMNSYPSILKEKAAIVQVGGR